MRIKITISAEGQRPVSRISGVIAGDNVAQMQLIQILARLEVATANALPGVTIKFEAI